MKKKMPVRGGGIIFIVTVVLFLMLRFTATAELERGVTMAESWGCCKGKKWQGRPHSVSIVEFGAVGDGKTMNTVAFQNAIFYLKSFADKGGAQLYIPEGRWVTGPFNLTSHLTIFLEKDAVIVGSVGVSFWQVVDPLPSYGRGLDLPGSQYLSLIYGSDLTDVVITGDNGIIDGQGGTWWGLLNSGLLKYSRPHLVEFVSSHDIVISNLTFVNPPAIAVHPVYCSGVLVQGVTITAPGDSPSTIGVVPDSSDHVCVEDSAISTGGDAISLKSGWDEYGISYGRPTTDVRIRRVVLRSAAGAALAVGSEMSGGISGVLAENIKVVNSSAAVRVATAEGRGGYVERVLISGAEIDGAAAAVEVKAEAAARHPDEGFDSGAVPVVRGVTVRDMVGHRVRAAGDLSGIEGAPFSALCLINVTLSASPATSDWVCSDVSGFAEGVSPPPCGDLRRGSSSRGCFSSIDDTFQGIWDF